MSANKARIEALIGSLDPILANDPPARWRPTCETLRTELDAAAKVHHSLRVVGPVIAAGLFFAAEGHRLSQEAIAPLALLGTCVATAAFAPDRRARVSAMAVVVPLMLWLGAMITDIHGYVTLALCLNLGVSFLLERIYPALEHRERITFLLDYFGFKIHDPNAPA